MSKRLSIVGNVHYEPSGALPGSSGDQDLGLQATTFSQLSDETLSLNAGSGAPVSVGPLPASLVAVKVVSGGPVTLVLSGPGGVDQAQTVSESACLVSLGSPFTAVKLYGIAIIELVVGAL